MGQKLSNCCKSKKRMEEEAEQEQIEKELNDMKLTGGSFMVQKEDKFKDKYMVGSALGTGYHSELRHCKNV